MNNDKSVQSSKILLVEDGQYIRELYITILETEGYDLDVSADGEDAFRKIHNNLYNLVLLDIMLPKMSGIDILDRLQKDNKQNTIGKIVLLTNLSQESIVAKAVTYGIRGYIVKSGYTPDQILDEVSNYLSR